MKLRIELECTHCGVTRDEQVDARVNIASMIDAAILQCGWRKVMCDFTLCPKCSKEFDELLARQIDEHRAFVHGKPGDPRWRMRKFNVQLMADGMKS